MNLRPNSTQPFTNKNYSLKASFDFDLTTQGTIVSTGILQTLRISEPFYEPKPQLWPNEVKVIGNPKVGSRYRLNRNED